MKLRNLTTNTTELEINGNYILFSYDTPVAGYDDEGAFRTDEYYSRTTTKHINNYLGNKNIGRVVKSEYIYNLIEG